MAGQLLMHDTSPHQQLHQNAMNLHQQTFSHHQQVMDMHRNITTGMTSMAPVTQPAQQQGQITYHTVSSPVPQQPQIMYQTSMPQQYQQQHQIAYQTPTAPAPAQVQLLDNVYQQYQQQPPFIAAPPSQPLGYVQENAEQYKQQRPRLQLPAVQNSPAQTDRPDVHTQHPQFQQIGQQQQKLLQELPSAQNSPPQVNRPGFPAQYQPHFPQIEQAPPIVAAHNTPSTDDNGDRFTALELKRNEDIETMNRESARINKRLQGLERSNTQSQKDSDAKDHEIRRLNDQIAAKELQRQHDSDNQKRLRELDNSQATAKQERETRRLKEELASIERARREDAERNSQQLADLVRSQATSPSSGAGPALDMSALQKVIRETQAQQLSTKDIERVIGEQLGKRLEGIASKADLQNAGRQMEGALNKVPPGLSEAQVQQAVSRELNNVMENMAKRANRQQQQYQHMSVEGQPLQQTHDWQTSQKNAVIQELPHEAVALVSKDTGLSQRARKKQAALPAAPTSSMDILTKPDAPAVANNATGDRRNAAIEASPSIPQKEARRADANKTPNATIEAPPMPTSVPEGALVRSSPHSVKGNAPVQSRDSNEMRQYQSPASTSNSSQALGREVTRPRQIEAARSQRQLEAPPSDSQPNIVTGHELVRQQRGLAKRAPR